MRLSGAKKSNDSAEQARASTFHLLKVRPRSESELKLRLTRKGFTPEVVAATLEEFKGKGLIDDKKFARFFATQKMFIKPSGRRALLSELKAKGISPVLADQAVEEATGGKDEFEVASELASQRLAQMKDLPRQTIERRLYGFLGRRGFSSDVIYRVLRELVRS